MDLYPAEQSRVLVHGEVIDEAEDTKLRLNEVLDAIHDYELDLARSYVQLGLLLNTSMEKEYWREWGFDSRGKFIDSLRARIDRRRAQIYNILSVVERLYPQISEENLEAMGITKAQWLSWFVKHSGRAVPAALLESALDPGIKADRLKAAVYKELHQVDDRQGRWHDVGGAWWEDHEWEEFQQSYQLAKIVDPPSQGSEWEILKDVMLKWAREFASSNVQLMED